MFWITVMAIVFAAFRLFPMNGSQPPAVSPVPARPSSVQTAPRPLPTPPVAARALPYEGSRAMTPDTAPIYRCGAEYRHAPCAGGRAIDGPAASGFDSRPSERLARLVAEGRTADGNTVTTVVRNGTEVSSAAGVDRFAMCQALAAEIAGIDAETRQPRSASRQDQLRAQRRMVRDRQARLHC